MNKVKGAFDKVVEWDRNLAKKVQDKFNLTDYQMLCVSFAKGFVIGAILLFVYYHFWGKLFVESSIIYK